MMKTRVLFVDDDPFVLSAQKRLLWDMANWECEFVQSGNAALALLEERPAEVVISDMRMPRMDGSELLQEVCQRWPQTIRIILSGQAEEDVLAHFIGPAHHYLSKPCPSNELRAVVDQSLHFLKLSTDYAGFVTGLPNRNLGPGRMQIVELTEKFSTSSHEIVESVSKDGHCWEVLRQIESYLQDDLRAGGMVKMPRELLDPMAVASTIYASLIESGLIDPQSLAATWEFVVPATERHYHALRRGSVHAVRTRLVLLGSLLCRIGFDLIGDMRSNVARPAELGACVLERFGLPHAVFAYSASLAGASMTGAVQLPEEETLGI